MKQEKLLTQAVSIAGLILMIAFGAQTAQAQYRGVRPFVDCVEREFSGGAATGNYIAYFGYTSDESAPVVFFPRGANNYFYPDEDVSPQVSTFYFGTHPRVVSIVVPIGTDETWFLGSSYATASFQASKFCGSDETNSRLITYQGKLSDGAAAANGTYDLQFQLFNQARDGTARTSKITLDDVPVTNGVFTVQLDFSANSFPLNPAILDAENSFFEISVRAGNSTGAYTVLTPRQPLTAVPLAMRANTANNAFRAANADNAAQLGGTAADQFVKTTDGRLSDARTPTAGSANYIQNTTTTQATSNFNISGTGEANVFNVRTQFNIGGRRILSNGGFGNLFAGAFAGNANSSGGANLFVGAYAGYVNTEGDNNAFVGGGAGYSNTTGNDNAFIGNNAGNQNTTGANNSFVGKFTGYSNTTGSQITILGANADVGANNLTYATAIGAEAVVSSSNTIVLGRANGSDAVQIPGGLTVSGNLSSGCRAGFTAVANGRLCISEMQPADTYYAAAQVCTDMGARIGNSADVALSFTLGGFNYFAGSPGGEPVPKGWLADIINDNVHATWNATSPNQDFDGTPLNVNTGGTGGTAPQLLYRCVY